MAVRPLDDLVSVAQPAWPGVCAMVERAPVGAKVLPIETARGERVLFALQVSAASTLGAVALNCGGIVVDQGWLRILGGGTEVLPDLASANDLATPAEASTTPGFLIVGYDVLGGVFAVAGGDLGVAPGDVCFRGPDTLQWVGLGIGHGGFVQASLSGALSDFYADLRWPGWEAEVAAVHLDQGLSVYPPPFTEQGHDLSSASRRPVPFSELLAFYDDMAVKVAAIEPGAAFDLRISE